MKHRASNKRTFRCVDINGHPVKDENAYIGLGSEACASKMSSL